MMGTKGGDQDRLFYSFNLDKHIPADHLLRRIDRFLDFSKLRQRLEPFYSHTGRPSIDPELMIRMLLVGYCFGIRSERRLCEEVHLNLAYRWFCRLGIEDEVPDHSSFSKNRHGRFRESDLFRQLFEDVVRRCMSEGLVRGEGFAVDASIVQADANRRRGVPSEQAIDWRDPGLGLGSRAVQEYLEKLEQEGQIGAAPKNISLTDPAARWTAAPGCPAYFAYSTNYLVDVHAGVIMDVEATAAHRIKETEATKAMIERVEDRLGIKPSRLIADTAYGSGPMLGWLVNDKQIEPHIPVLDKSEREDGTFSRSDFTWDERADEYRCPGNKPLRREWRAFSKPRTHITKAETIFGHIGAMLERGPWVNGETVTRQIFVLDVESGSPHTGVSLFLYTKKDVVSASDDTVTVTLSRTISLPLVGGTGVHASMAQNNSYLYVGTTKSTQAASVRLGTWTVTPIGGFSPPIPVASISSDSYGYITVTFGAPGGTFSGFYVFGPTGASEGDGGGAEFMLNTSNAVTPAALP